MISYVNCPVLYAYLWLRERIRSSGTISLYDDPSHPIYSITQNSPFNIFTLAFHQPHCSLSVVRVKT